MLVIPQKGVSNESTEARWDSPIEKVLNSIPSGASLGKANNILKRPDIGQSDRLLIGAIGAIPSNRRPWGIMSWLATFYKTSRQTIYNIAGTFKGAQPQNDKSREKRELFILAKKEKLMTQK